MNEDLTIKAISTYNANLHRGMTAALEAVVAMALEEAARVFDDMWGGITPDEVAAAIRALIHKEVKN